ncbi:MAG: peptidylprolyl isomerase [Pseudohongiellaceae bacterium]
MTFQSTQLFSPLKLAGLAAALMLSACGGDSEPVEADPVPVATDDLVMPTPEPAGPELLPLPGLEGSVPAITEVITIVMSTGTGDLTIEIYPQAAPNAAARFVELVEAGFYDNTPVFRVVPGFVAQFGINWRGDYPAWQDNTFDDDPTLFALERGTLAFAKAGPNTNSTQVFINYVENNRLADPQYNFTVFGKVVDGMDAVDQFVSVGDPGGGLDQFRLWNDGAAYLESLDTQPVMINSATVVSATP